MASSQPAILTVKTTIDAPLSVVWKCWTTPDDIKAWNSASDDWHTTRAENELRKGGRFLSRMEARDGSFGFDFSGTYSEVIPERLIEYTIDDGRKVRVSFQQTGKQICVIESFEAESTHPLDQQKAGWQAILDNFKKYTEASTQK